MYDTPAGKRYSGVWVEDEGDAYIEALIVRCTECNKTFERFDPGTRDGGWPEEWRYQEGGDLEVRRS